MDIVYHFPPFHLEAESGRLMRGLRNLPLRPKTFAFLTYLLARPNHLITKHQLLAQLWPGLVVGEAALTVCVHELRRALGDDSRKPRFIQTAHGRGYRFIAPVFTHAAQDARPPAAPRPQTARGLPLVGRAAELSRLDACWHQALAGTRQTVLISGEPGIGKSTLLNAFLRSLPTHECLIGLAQCAAWNGQGTTYGPLLAILEKLCRGPGAADVRSLLRRHAPAWIVQTTELLEPGEFSALALRTAGTGSSQMMRELAAALELLSEMRPLILVCEDLHLSDVHSLKLLSYLAGRRESARLLLIATYRDGESGGHFSPEILREFQARGQCHELPLSPLSEAAVAEYLRRHLNTAGVSPALVEQVYRRCGGNALFLAMLVDQLMENEPTDVARRPDQMLNLPAGIRALIESRLDRLPVADQRLLEVASVAGLEFAAAVLNGVSEELAQSPSEIEMRCEELARRGEFLMSAGVAQWPDLTVTAKYSFRHALCQEVLYHRLDAARRRDLHRAVGLLLERAYGSRAAEIATDLARHFEYGGDLPRAATYLTEAARSALSRSAGSDAIAQARKALQMIDSLPAHAAQPRLELQQQMILGAALMSIAGMGAEEVGRVYRRALLLIERLGQDSALVPALLGIAKFHIVRDENDAAQALGRQCLRLAREAGDDGLELEAHVILGAVQYSRGQLAATRLHCEQALALYDPALHRGHALVYGLEPGATACVYRALCLWRMGYPDQARAQVVAAAALAQESGHVHTQAISMAAVATLHACCGDWRTFGLWNDRLLALTAEKEVVYWHAWALFFRGQQLTALGQLAEGAAQMRAGIEALKATGADFWLAETLRLRSMLDSDSPPAPDSEALLAAAYDEARRTGHLGEEAELQRLLGLLELRRECAPDLRQAAAERRFCAALEIARAQGALAYELRAAIALCRMWLAQGRRARAHHLLAAIYQRFTEGMDTADLRQARLLLDQLAA